MRTLKVQSLGESAQGVVLKGDPRTPEPVHFRVCFPGGDLEVVRASDGEDADYWVHIRVNDAEEHVSLPGAVAGRLVDARLDVRGKHTSETNVGDFDDPNLYHLAVRVQRMR